MKRNDMLLIIVVIAIGLLMYFVVFTGKSGDNIEVVVDGDIMGTYAMTEDRIIHIDNMRGGDNTIVIRNGAVYMEDANCPNKICVEQGSIMSDGETICCAPNGIMVIVRSQIKGDFDAITR